MGIQPGKSTLTSSLSEQVDEESQGDNHFTQVWWDTHGC